MKLFLCTMVLAVVVLSIFHANLGELRGVLDDPVFNALR